MWLCLSVSEFMICRTELIYFRYGKRSVASGEGQLLLHRCTFVVANGQGGTAICGGRHTAKLHAAVKLSGRFKGAGPRNVCTEAGLFAIRAEREYGIDEDFMKAVAKVQENKKLKTKLDYKPV